jgi:prevent-host-death family protein
MTKRYSITETRRQLSGLVRRAEAGKPVQITRRGEPVAVIVSLEQAASVGKAPRRQLGDVIRELRQKIERDPSLAIEPEDWLPPRDKSPGRDFHWDV